MILQRRSLLQALAALPAAGLGSAARAESPWDDAQPVSRAQIAAAFRRQMALGYRLDAIANAVRVQTGVLLALAETASAADAQQRPLRIDHRDFFATWCEVTGIAAEAVPSFIRAPNQAKEDYLVDYRIATVLDLEHTRDRPRRALNVKAGWPAAPGAPPSYSYEDRSTDPHIKTTRAQVTSWRILDYGDVIVYDDVQGVGGRATSGLLGAIFSVIGHAQARRTLYTIAPDGSQVSRTTALKGITLEQTVTILPEGRVITGLPAGRPDLEALERRLIEWPLRVVYRAMDRAPLPAR